MKSSNIIIKALRQHIENSYKNAGKSKSGQDYKPSKKKEMH